MLNKINERIDQVMVINLPEAKERYDEYIRDFSDMGFKDINRVEAIRPNGGRTPKDGYLGNRLSHIKCIKIARDLNLSNVLVCEDDARFDRKKIEEINSIIDDFVSFLDSDIDWSHLYFGAGHKDPPKDTKFNHIKKMVKAWSVHCYLVNSKYFDTIIDNMEKVNISIDKAYHYQYQTKDICYSLHPRLVYQKEGYSYITKKEEDYRFFHQD